MTSHNTTPRDKNENKTKKKKKKHLLFEVDYHHSPELYWGFDIKAWSSR